LQLLPKGDLNTALVKMWQAMRFLEAAAATLDLAPYNSLLALSAKSTAVTAILEAETETATAVDVSKTAEANELSLAGDSELAAGNFVQAVDLYRRAARRVQGIIN